VAGILLDKGLLAQIPEIDAMKGFCLRAIHPEGDVFQHTRLMLELLPEEVSCRCLSVYSLDWAKPGNGHCRRNRANPFNDTTDRRSVTERSWNGAIFAPEIAPWSRWCDKHGFSKCARMRVAK